MRPIEITRQEAEDLVDLLEGRGGADRLSLAAELRKQWGMVARNDDTTFADAYEWLRRQPGVSRDFAHVPIESLAALLRGG